MAVYLLLSQRWHFFLILGIYSVDCATGATKWFPLHFSSVPAHILTHSEWAASTHSAKLLLVTDQDINSPLIDAKGFCTEPLQQHHFLPFVFPCKMMLTGAFWRTSRFSNALFPLRLYFPRMGVGCLWSRCLLREVLSWNHNYRTYNQLEIVNLIKNSWSQQNVCISPEGEVGNWGNKLGSIFLPTRWVGRNLQENPQQPLQSPQEHSDETLVEFLAFPIKQFLSYKYLRSFARFCRKYSGNTQSNVHLYFKLQNLQIFGIFVLMYIVENFRSWAHSFVWILVSFRKYFKNCAPVQNNQGGTIAEHKLIIYWLFFCSVFFFSLGLVFFLILFSCLMHFLWSLNSKPATSVTLFCVIKNHKNSGNKPQISEDIHPNPIAELLFFF